MFKDLDGLINITLSDDTQTVYALARNVQWCQLSDDAKYELYRSYVYLYGKVYKAHCRLINEFGDIVNSLTKQEISALPDKLREFVEG